MTDLKKAQDLEVQNVRFKDAVFLRGQMNNNYKQGHYNGKMSLEKSGVLIDIPADREAPRFVTIVPFANIKQIEFETD